MRLFIRSAAIVATMLAAGGSTLAAQQAPVRIAYVNPQALFDNAPGRAAAESLFTRETAGYRAELSKMSDALTQMVGAYQREEARLTAAQKETRQRAIAAKEDSLRGRQQQLEQQASQRQSELMAPIMESVRKVLEDIRVEDGYAIILSSEPGSSPILAADKNLDITERVVARLKTVQATRASTPATQARPTGAPTASPAGVTRPRPPER
ncbi:MAG TPA: OmpH family outer membrane protein [Gemmatimonadaceae bacterium]|nr:OmpH family outer membrane protein [Gemmatimonadaceae bacterium]